MKKLVKIIVSMLCTAVLSVPVFVSSVRIPNTDKFTVSVLALSPWPVVTVTVVPAR